jgi:tudor domain-containing protein 3
LLQFGWQVRLEDKAVIRSGIVCLNPKVLTLLGGLVQPLYEEWQMNQKYSGFSRSPLRLSQESDTGGPPPFEKLQIKASSHRFAQQGRHSGQFSKHFYRLGGFEFVF